VRFRSKAAFIKRVRSPSSGASCGRVERCWGRETVCGRAPRGRGRFGQCVCRIIASSEGVEPISVQTLGLDDSHPGLSRLELGPAMPALFGRSANSGSSGWLCPPILSHQQSNKPTSVNAPLGSHRDRSPLPAWPLEGLHSELGMRGRLPTRSNPWAGAWAAPRDRACARMEARRRIGLSRVARGERVIASRARSDPIPLLLGVIRAPQVVTHSESTTSSPTAKPIPQDTGSGKDFRFRLCGI